MFLFEEILSIDYGSGFIKGILFKKMPGETLILQKNILELTPVNDGDEFSYNLNRFLNAYFPNIQNFIINLALENTFVRDLELPVTSAKTLKEIIPFEVESLVPFPIENLAILHRVWKTDETGSSIVTFNVHHDEINRILTPFIAGKFNLKTFSVDSYSLSSLLKREYVNDPTAKISGQVDIGSKGSIFNVCYEGNLCFTRHIHIGGQKITALIAKDLKIPLKKAEEIKKAVNFNILDPKADLEIKKDFQKSFKLTAAQMNSVFKNILQVMEEIAKETVRSIYSLPENMILDKLYLSGGGAEFEFTEAMFAKAIGVPVARFNLKEIDDDQYINCYANIIHHQLPKTEKIDFLTTDYAKKMNIYSLNQDQFRPHMILAAAATLLLLFVFVTGIFSDRKKIAANELILAKKFEAGFGKKLPEGMSAIEAADAAVKIEFKNTEIFRKFYNKPDAMDTILEITSNFPSRDVVDFQLDQLVYDNDEVMIYGKVNEFAEVGTITDNLSRSAMFKNISVVNKSLLSGSKSLKIKFQLKLEIQDKKGEEE